MRKLVIALAVLGSLLVVPSANAAPIPSVFGGDVPCANFDNGTPGNPADDQQRCGVNGTNEVETLTIDATGGTFTLDLDGQVTSAIAFDATAAAVDSALEALPVLGAGDVTVTGAAGGPYTITFTGAFAKTDVDELVGDGTEPDRRCDDRHRRHHHAGRRAQHLGHLGRDADRRQRRVPR